jgi:deoxyribonuclease-4
MYIGAHESASGGPYKAVGRALEDGCESLQIFTKNNNRWNQRMWTDKEAGAFREAYAESGLQGVVSHGAYLINLCSETEKTRQKSYDALADELERCQLLGIPYLVIHPGSPGDSGDEWGIAEVGRAVNALYAERGDGWRDVTLLFENTAGQGSTLAWRIEHLRDIIGELDAPERFGVCFDTCHAHAAGYDLRERDGYDAFWQEFDAIVGLDKLKCFHLNDSKKPLGSRVDRHDDIGAGDLGSSVFEFLVNDSRFAEHIAVVETPAADDGPPHKANIDRLKDLRE